ncbi:MAG: phosphoribosylglycinamide formyltransferase [Imperialibacter sp.]|uniref:phosphoribosylglycinamide formyltransferase n=1 Tax=Imperialibacter sp. TaxID=2038411 RepID=UPI0030DB09BD|tara:strand:- start:5710 stop:6279 length:570 start_codon:yes stop_codon:yes gene_type:complete
MKKNLAIFASGSGTNAENIVKHFKGNSDVGVKLILSNKKDAGVLERAKKLGIPSHVFSRPDFYENNNVLDVLKAHNVDWVVLAGFLWLIPGNLIKAFPDKIINIHPALLPKFGGKGMYGDRVHQAVIQAGEKDSGITIHLVNEKYDEGKILFQASCDIEKDETPQSLAAKIHQLEYTYFPQVIHDQMVQ